MENDLEKLEEAVENYRANGSAGKETFEEALLHCVRKSRNVIIDGEPIDGKEGHYNPAGVTTSDGFWLAIWTSKEKALEGGAQYPVEINIRAMIRVLKSNQINGFAMNPKRGEPFLTIEASTLEGMLQIADRETARWMN